MTMIPSVVRSVARIAVAGLVASALVGAAGWSLERRRLGATDEEGLSRVRAQLTDRFERASRALSARAEHLAAARDIIRAARRGDDQGRPLFDLLDREVPAGASATAGLSVLDPTGVPVAWVGRVTDLPRERTDGPRALFVAPDVNGPRLVRIEPVADPERPSGPRLATIVAEQRVDLTGLSELTESLTLPALAGDVDPRDPPRADHQRPNAFEIRSSDGQLLLEATLSPSKLAVTRAQWRSWTRAAMFAALTLALILGAGPLLKWRRAARASRTVVAATLSLIAVAVAARFLIWLAMAPLAGRALDVPLALLPNALFLAAMVWLIIDSLERWRVGPPRARLRAPTAAMFGTVALFAFLAALGATTVLWAYERLLRSIAAHSSFDLLHFSLHPLEITRLCIAFGLVLLHAAVIWLAAAMVRAPVVWLRMPRSLALIATRSLAAGVGVAVVVLATRSGASAIPVGPLLIGVTVAFLGAAVLSRPHAPIRRASQTARFGLLFLVLLIPAVAMYPSIDAFATATRERTIA